MNDKSRVINIFLILILIMPLLGNSSATVSANKSEIDSSKLVDASPGDLSLWYDEPANSWVNEALPIGNGYMGGMIFGGIEQEHIQFNEKTYGQAALVNGKAIGEEIGQSKI